MKLKNFICYQRVLLGECMTFNQGVTGSNPVGLTILKYISFKSIVFIEEYKFFQNYLHKLKVLGMKMYGRIVFKGRTGVGQIPPYVHYQ